MFGGASRAKAVNAQTRTDNVLYGKRLPSKDWAQRLPSRDRATSHHNETNWMRRLRPLNARDVAGHNVGDYELHLIPRPHRLDAPLYIPVRIDVDAHAFESDAHALTAWINETYFSGCLFIQPSSRGFSGWAIIEFDPLKTYELDPNTGEMVSELMRSHDGRLIYPKRQEINWYLQWIDFGLGTVVRDAGYKSKAELKGRFHLTRRSTANYCDPDYVDALDYYRDHPTEHSRDYPRAVINYGQPVKLPRITTREQLNQFKGAVVSQRSLELIARDANLRTWRTNQPLHISNVENWDEVQRCRIRRRLSVCDAEEDDCDVNGFGFSDPHDTSRIADDQLDYMSRVAAVCREALREMGGDVGKAFGRALKLGEDSGIFTGPAHRERERLVSASLRFAMRTFRKAKVLRHRKASVWFTSDDDVKDMARRLKGCLSKVQLAAANRSHPQAAMTYTKLAQIYLLMQKSIVTGNVTHVSTAGLLSFARHPRVGFRGINGPAIAAAKSLLVAANQIQLVREHQFTAGQRGECARWVLGKHPILQDWIQPALCDAVRACHHGLTGKRGSVPISGACPPPVQSWAGTTCTLPSNFSIEYDVLQQPLEQCDRRQHVVSRGVENHVKLQPSQIFQANCVGSGARIGQWP